jgi:uncharacterized membrane protein YfcA
LYTVPPISLALNIIVSSAAFFNYLKAGHLSLRLSFPLLISIPFAFIGGSIILSEKMLTLIFVISLFSASAALLLSGRRRITFQREKIRKMNLNFGRTALITTPLGALLGSISGLVGIGGGIWLSPILIMSGLANPKQAAASASLFILTNSISGFIAHTITKDIDFGLVIPLSIVVLIGGLMGSRLGALKFDHQKIIIIIGILVALAAINLATRLFK